MREPTFLTLAEVVEVHSDQIRRYGGQDGIRDLGLLESALAQPEASFGGVWLHQDLYEMASAYAYPIGENHPFINGNKRAGLACALVFLEINDLPIADPKGKLQDAMLKVAVGSMLKQKFADLLRQLPV